MQSGSSVHLSWVLKTDTTFRVSSCGACARLVSTEGSQQKLNNSLTYGFLSYAGLLIVLWLLCPTLVCVQCRLCFILLYVWERRKRQRVKCVRRRDSNVCLCAVTYTPCVSGCVCVECVVMSGDTKTLYWRSMSSTSQPDTPDLSPTVSRNSIFPVKIIKVCFYSNSSNLGKNFKLVRCQEGWTVRVYSTVYCALIYSAVLYCLLCTTPVYCALLYSNVHYYTLPFTVHYYTLLYSVYCAIPLYTVHFYTVYCALLYSAVRYCLPSITILYCTLQLT